MTDEELEALREESEARFIKALVRVKRAWHYRRRVRKSKEYRGPYLSLVDPYGNLKEVTEAQAKAVFISMTEFTQKWAKAILRLGKGDEDAQNDR
jgi:hypothetical protein